MNKEQLLKQENSALRAIAIQAKRLLLSLEIADATPEVMNLCELVERYEADFGEILPELKPHNKKAWYAAYEDKAQAVELPEALGLNKLT
jgi:hypothetical protein